METMGTVYLIHIDAKIAGHAQHYMGWAGDLKSRLGQHRRGTSKASKLMAEVTRLGLTWQLARTWDGEDRNFERKLKNRKNHRALCPFCNPNSWATNAPTERGKSYARKQRRTRTHHAQGTRTGKLAYPVLEHAGDEGIPLLPASI